MTGAADDKGSMAEYEYNGLGHRIGMRQGVLEYIGSNATVDFGTVYDKKKRKSICICMK